MTTTTVDPRVQYWIDAWDNGEFTEHAKAAARHLYALGAGLAVDWETMTYTAACASLNAAGLGYNARGIGYALNALAGICAKMHTPDLSSLFTTIYPPRHSRWRPGEREVEQQHCYVQATWPRLTV